MFIARNILSAIVTAIWLYFLNDMSYLPRVKSLLNQVNRAYITVFVVLKFTWNNKLQLQFYFTE